MSNKPPYLEESIMPTEQQYKLVRPPTAQDALRDLIGQLRSRLNQLEALQRALPQELSLPADEILRELFQKFGRIKSDY